ncbi:aaa family ATPase [Grosmannia clavigera kw1407]|uniref:Aaa family ATPase n=1 Tax=Grosmannia clavigera (strain kw1407 / UAMH 11150) TaxID=655863 RepID=F0XQG1_GROCL|nr:aaa family ATPase [Grosmannia clavigera kw1407]EFX00303.1 aaa family ATPase [Grosmannia clavigera kw1407]
MTSSFKNKAWGWRCKVLGSKDEKSLSDFSNNSTDSEKRPAAVKPVKETSGAALVVKTMYESDMRHGIYSWSDYPPRQQSKRDLKNLDRVAIKVYKIKDMDRPVIDGMHSLKHHKISIHNLALVAALDPILRAEDCHLDTNEPAEFEAPFQPLFFCYDAIVAAMRSRPDADPLKPFLQLLVCVMDEVFVHTWKKRRQLADKGLISFEHAWTYFQRGTVVRSHGTNSDVISRVVRTAYVEQMCERVLAVTVQALRFNGEAFEWAEKDLHIASFPGNRPLSKFDHCPMSHVKDGKLIMEHMARRGRRVLDLQGLTYCNYEGVGIFDVPEGHTEKHNVDGRILVDVAGFNRYKLAQGSREGKDSVSVQKVVEGTGRITGVSQYRGTVDLTEDNLTPKKDTPLKSATLMTGRLSEEEQATNKATMLTKPEDLMFISPLIEAYSLKIKLWLMVYVEDIRPIRWNDQAYDHLVYDEQQKDLVMSFVESHGHTRSRVDDVILGKGEGLIVLLSGPPGTGKTLMAEAVADRTHRPLLYLQAEDLGISAAVLGANVKKFFEMATEWNAIILLDEADVFMAERHPQDIARNELVSIFLRELEYYRGIIFMTTNLFSSIDKAFRSRVSLHLLFKPLLPEARLLVWQKFLVRATAARKEMLEMSRVVEVGAVEHTAQGDWLSRGVSGSSISNDDLKELSAWSLNGREIKTAVTMVTAWCEHKGHDLTLERLEHGIQATSPHASKAAMAESDELNGPDQDEQGLDAQKHDPHAV